MVNGLMSSPLKVFDQTQQHGGNWGGANRYGEGSTNGTAKFHYEIEVLIFFFFFFFKLTKRCSGVSS